MNSFRQVVLFGSVAGALVCGAAAFWQHRQVSRIDAAIATAAQVRETRLTAAGTMTAQLGTLRAALRAGLDGTHVPADYASWSRQQEALRGVVQHLGDNLASFEPAPDGSGAPSADLAVAVRRARELEARLRAGWADYERLGSGLTPASQVQAVQTLLPLLGEDLVPTWSELSRAARAEGDFSATTLTAERFGLRQWRLWLTGATVICLAVIAGALWPSRRPRSLVGSLPSPPMTPRRDAPPSRSPFPPRESPAAVRPAAAPPAEKAAVPPPPSTPPPAPALPPSPAPKPSTPPPASAPKPFPVAAAAPAPVSAPAPTAARASGEEAARVERPAPPASKPVTPTPPPAPSPPPAPLPPAPLPAAPRAEMPAPAATPVPPPASPSTSPVAPLAPPRAAVPVASPPPPPPASVPAPSPGPAVSVPPAPAPVVTPAPVPVAPVTSTPPAPTPAPRPVAKPARLLPTEIPPGLPRLLLADPQGGSVEILSLLLRNGGYEVTGCTGPAQVLTAVQRESFRVAVIAGEGAGFGSDLLGKVAALRPELPVIFLGPAKDAPASAEVPVVPKPVNPRLLLWQISELIYPGENRVSRDYTPPPPDPDEKPKPGAAPAPAKPAGTEAAAAPKLVRRVTPAPEATSIPTVSPVPAAPPPVPTPPIKSPVIAPPPPVPAPPPAEPPARPAWVRPLHAAPAAAEPEPAVRPPVPRPAAPAPAPAADGADAAEPAAPRKKLVRRRVVDPDEKP